MNIKPGGKQHRLQPTVIPINNLHPNLETQIHGAKSRI